MLKDWKISEIGPSLNSLRGTLILRISSSALHRRVREGFFYPIQRVKILRPPEPFPPNPEQFKIIFLSCALYDNEDHEAESSLVIGC